MDNNTTKEPKRPDEVLRDREEQVSASQSFKAQEKAMADRRHRLDGLCEDLDERLAPIKTAHVIDVLSNMRKSAQDEADEYFAGERGRALDRIKTIEDIAKKLRINLKDDNA